MIKKILLNIILLLMAQFALATIQAGVDRSTIEFGQSITLTITLQNSGDNPNLDSLNKDFEIYGTSSSSQYSIINGNSSSQFSYKVTLMPKNKGKQIIPPIKVGNDFTNPISIEVTSSAGTQSQPQNPQGKDKIYLDVTAEKKPNLYVGVPVLLEIKVYYQVAISNIRMDPLDISNAKLEVQGKVVQYKDNHPGSNYQVVEQKYLITPESAGDITIPPVRITGVALDNQSQNIFVMMNGRPFVLNSKPIILHVKPVPPEINPDSWLPATKLEVTESWSQESDPLMVGQIITRNITIDATGISASSLPNLTFKTPSGVNSYPDKPTLDDSSDASPIRARKTFKIVYVPTQAGTIEFPTSSIQWWDLNANKLKTAIIPAKTINVKSNENKLNNANKVFQLAESGIKHNKVTEKLPIKKMHVYYWIIVVVIVILILIIIYFVRKWIYNHLAQDKTQVSGHVKEKVALMALTQACTNKDLFRVNSALITWASAHWQRNIYTISDIKDLSDNVALNQLIDKLNLALYRGDSFNEFDNLEVEIIKIEATKINKPKALLKSFYPD